MIKLRGLGRRLKLNRLAARIVTNRSGYEDRFQKGMLDAIRAGDCIWDVGANVGLYTAAFADRTGPNGLVVAFEPSPQNFDRLRQAVLDRSNVRLLGLALGNAEGEARLQQGRDSLGATSKLLENDSPSVGTTVIVETARGDHLVSSGRAPLPNVLKIDTEGFELDVLTGLAQTLDSPSLRTLCIEVHFALLQARGIADAPARIEDMLRKAGFSIRWPDASHIIASKPA